jgi:4a-hydroxytetrahydrobiopterin dehydratase
MTDDILILAPEVLKKAVSDLDHWWLADDDLAIEKSFRFGNFPEAMAFLVQVGFAAEAMNHHPEITHVFDNVVVRLTTHDPGGVTVKDLKLAQIIDTIQRRDGDKVV